jgi:hypothetical protein
MPFMRMITDATGMYLQKRRNCDMPEGCSGQAALRKVKFYIIEQFKRRSLLVGNS